MRSQLTSLFKSGTRQGNLLSTLLFSTSISTLLYSGDSSVVKKEKKKRHLNMKEEVKLFLFVGDMIFTEKMWLNVQKSCCGGGVAKYCPTLL